MIPLSRPCLDNAERDAVVRVLESGWLAHGPLNREFEEAFARLIGVEHAVSLNSCTSALHLAIEALGLDGEVVVPSFTFVASANAVFTAGATPVFADIDEATRNVDAQTIEAALTERTQAIMPVHFGGQACDMRAIVELANRRGLVVIEDAAETIGGTCDGQVAGSFGIAGCFSFFPTKNLTTGEGGMLVTDDDELAARVRSLSAHGISTHTVDREKAERPWYRAAELPGYNFRMSQVLAAIGVEQVGKLAAMNGRRRDHARFLDGALDGEVMVLPVERPNRMHVYQMYTVQVDTGFRDAFVRELRDLGVAASVHFDPPVHVQPCYRERWPGLRLPVTEKVSASIVTLPLYPHMTDAELETMAETVNACARRLTASAGVAR